MYIIKYYGRDYMKNEITGFGSGMKIAALGFPYFAFTIVLSRIHSHIFSITFISEDILFIVGVILLIIGESANALSTAKMIKAFSNNKLAKEGPYSVCANPMYASQIFLSAPGVALMMGSWLVLTTTIAGFILVRFFIKGEEEYLREQFGEEYEEYKKGVLIKFI